jgi:signal transduction histidine kinase/sensor domain CHASE-containing protein
LGLLLPVWWQAGQWYQAWLLADRRAQVAADLAQYGTALTSTLRQHFAPLNELSVFVQSLSYAASDPALADEFESFAAGLYSGEVGVRYFAVAPGGIQRYVYPLAGNEAVLGRNLFSEEQPSVQAEVQRALDSRQITLSRQTGSNSLPLELTARLAVYRGEAFWGLVTMGLDVTPLLSEAGLDTHPPDLDLALRTRTGHVFYGRGAVFEADSLIYRVELPGDSWELAGVPTVGWPASIQSMLLLFQSTGLMMVVLLVGLVYLVINRQARLALAVAQRTQEISKVNQELEAERRLLEQRVADRTRELSALYEVTAVASETLDLTSTLERSLDQVLSVMRVEAGAIHLLEPTAETLRLATWRGLAPRVVAETDSLTPGRGLAGWVLKHSEPLVVPDTATDPRAAGLCLARDGQAYAGAPLRASGRALGVLSVMGEVGRPFEVEEVALLASIADEIGVAVENAQLYEAERAQRQQADTLLQVASVVGSTLDLNEVLVRILDQLRRVVAYDSASVQLLAEAGLQLIAARGFAHRQAGDGTSLLPEELPHYQVVVKGRPLNLVDAPALYPAFREPPFNHIHSWLGVPLQVQERIIGMIAMNRQEPGGFNPVEVRLATALADQAALALENARLYGQAEQLAVMEERSRLARELHDSVTQSLYSLTLFAEAGRRAAEAGQKQRELGYLVRLGQVSHQALKEMRLLVYELRPATLETEGLVAALQQRLDAVEKRAGVEARLLVEAMVELPLLVEEGLYRIAQEALNNILKHAAATAVTVRLKAGREWAELEVIDNGRAFDPANLSNGAGLGLNSMRERAERLGGLLTIYSQPGEGTRVQAKVPTRRSWSRPTLPANHLTKVSP